MGCYVLDLRDIDRTAGAVAGGKGALLGELSRIDGIRVPDGYCVTTHAFRRMLAEVPSLDDRIDALARAEPEDRETMRNLSAEIRRALEQAPIPDALASAITAPLETLGEQAAYAVRSSATAEDSPTASFAGQYDTYLNVVGPGAVLQHVSRCWASLFTERAVTYRLRNGIDHRQVEMAVIVQQMVVPLASGILFTADPVTFNRKVVSIEASPGLGEALVSGLVNADIYKVRDGEVVEQTTPPDRTAPDRPEQPALTGPQIVALAQLGRQIEMHFGSPQDIEWCLADDFWFVQSRPITTLFPIPATGDDENHVFISVGHQQMMTDAMKPLGLSVWQLTAARPMYEAGGRLFVDVAPDLASPAARARRLALLEGGDPLVSDALQTILDRGDFIPRCSDEDAPAPGGILAAAGRAPIATDPAIVTALIERSETSIATLKREIQTRSGPALLEFILEDIQELKRILFDPLSLAVIMAGMQATGWLNEHLQAWLGETNAADTLSESVPRNVTSEMGLALLDVADVIRPHPDVVAFLDSVDDDGFLDELPVLSGGREARDAIRAYLDTYGMRCVGEIDVTRPRWSERPTTLVPLILGNVRNFAPGAGKRRFEEGRREAANKAAELLERLRELPDGERNAEETRSTIDRLRTFSGYREYPKYGLVSRYFVYKQALLEEAERLVSAGLLRAREDIFYLRFHELHDVVCTHRVDDELLRERKRAFRAFEALTPPRVLTSDGEVVTGTYRRGGLPPGALVGLPVSAGVVEGRARVIRDLAQADLEADDILVTAYTDPSWAPLFLTVKGLVTEVGGLMTHGAVIAREYGLPAVVGVEHATALIRDGQRIRVHGTDGYVEVLGDGSSVGAGICEAATVTSTQEGARET